MTLTARMILIGLVLGVSSPASADEYADSVAATRRGDHATAFKRLKPLAEKGDVKAQSDLGALYLAGQGAPQNAAEGVKWLRRAADQGLAAAQFNLGVLYLDGGPVGVDYAEAMKWSLRAASQGLAAAQLNVGSMYYEGKGVAQDFAEAARWIRLAAINGDAEAQLNLGTMFVSGRGVERDLVRGYMWTRLATEKLATTEDEKKALLEMSSKALSAEDRARGDALADKCRASKLKDCGL